MAIMDTIKKFIVPEVDDVAEDMEIEERTPLRMHRDESSAPSMKKAKVVSINQGGASSKIVIAKLDSSASVKTIINSLKDRIPVVFSIARLDRNDAARVVDVVYGAAFAVDGNMQKVSNDIFLVTPHGIEITGDVAAELMDSSDFSLDI